jgi:glycosyltransferase involved in cell wall biosynthesis
MAGNTFVSTRVPSSGSGRATPGKVVTTLEKPETKGSVAVGPGAAAPRISIIIPAMNEARNLPHVLPKLPTDCEIILVDGHSTDETVREAQRLRPDIVVIGQTRVGKGNALACGFAAATGEFIVMIDADGSNDPAEIPRFVAALEGGADFAKGSRFLPGGGSHDISAFRRAGNFWLNKMVNVLYRTRYTDLCYGYNAFRQNCLGVMRLLPPDVEGSNPANMLWGDGFEIETLINLRIAKAGLTVTEVPSFEAVRNFGASNLNAFSDGLRVLRTIRNERKRAQRYQPSVATWPKGEPGLSVVIEEAS